jgi:hypothetical protein
VPAGLGLKPVSASNKTYNGFRDRRSVPRIARKHWLRRPLRCPARQPVRLWASKGRASRVLVLWSDSARPSARPELRRARVSRRRVPTARGAWCVAESVNALFVEPSPPGDGAANVGEAGQRSPGIPDSTRPYLVRNPGVTDRTFSVGFFGAGVPPGRLGAGGTTTAVVAALAALPRPAWSTSHQSRVVYVPGPGAVSCAPPDELTATAVRLDVWQSCANASRCRPTTVGSGRSSCCRRRWLRAVSGFARRPVAGWC